MATSRKKSRSGSMIKWFLFCINILATAGLLLSYAAGYISPEKYWYFGFFGLAFPIFLLLNIAFVVLWLITWKKFIWIPLLAILIGFDQIASIIQFRSQNEQFITGNTLKVMTFNVHSLYGITNKNNFRGFRSRVTDFISQEHPDILCIQEFFVKAEDTSMVLERFTRTIGSKYCFAKNYYETKEGNKINAIAIFSKYPVVGNGSFRLSNRNTFGIYTDLLIKEDTIRIFNLHLQSIRFGDEDYSFYSHLTEAETEKFKLTEGSLKIFTKLKKAFYYRALQVDVIRKSIDSSPYRVVVCGDFNDTPSSYTYHVLSKGLNDSFRKAGSGLFGNTYAGNFPSFRLDYIFFGKDMNISSYRRYKTDLSDHYPVSVSLHINP
jgi:endonuclease/exonuclease/phosphatase family metal-dependent hydrolase